MDSVRGLQMSVSPRACAHSTQPKTREQAPRPDARARANAQREKTVFAKPARNRSRSFRSRAALLRRARKTASSAEAQLFSPARPGICRQAVQRAVDYQPSHSVHHSSEVKLNDAIALEIRPRI